VRQALESSIDRDALNQVVFEGNALPGNQWMPPTNSYYVKDFPIPPRDVAAAKRLLAEAGVPNPSFELTVPNNPETQQVAQVLQSMAAEAGFSMQLKATETNTALQAAMKGDFDAYLTYWSGRIDPDNNLYNFVACNAPLNDSHYCNAEVDRELDLARTVEASTDRLVHYRNVAEQLLRDKPAIYLYHNNWLYAANPNLAGLAVYPDGLIRPQGPVEPTDTGESGIECGRRNDSPTATLAGRPSSLARFKSAGSSGSKPMSMRRRGVLFGSIASFLLSLVPARARILVGKLPWHPSAGVPPMPVRPGGWEFFTAEEAASVEALVDRLIPPDPKTPGGKDAGCAVFIDRQLAGPYGKAQGLYMRPPFHEGTPQQGAQSAMTPAEQYRAALAALDKHCRATQSGKRFAELTDEQKDKTISGLEDGSIQLETVHGQQFFDHLLQNTREGFFADPIYGGNRDMVGWKMIGFPGTRYDYREWVDHHNEPYPLPPVSIQGRPEWTARQ